MPDAEGNIKGISVPELPWLKAKAEPEDTGCGCDECTCEPNE